MSICSCNKKEAPSVFQCLSLSRLWHRYCLDTKTLINRRMTEGLDHGSFNSGVFRPQVSKTKRMAVQSAFTSVGEGTGHLKNSLNSSTVL